MARIRKYGAKLNVVEAAEDNLPAGCAWIKARSVSEAYRKMHERVLEGEMASAIWLPPKTKKLSMVRDFFAASAGGLVTPSWRFSMHVSQGRGLRKQVDRFFDSDSSMLVADQTYRSLKLPFYLAARDEMQDWYDTILEHGKPRRISLYTESLKKYRAHPLSYKIHADSGLSEKGCRILLGLSGDNAYLYDDTQLERDDESLGFMTFRPKGDKLTVWSPPERAVVMLHYGNDNKPHNAVHSAKGTSRAAKPQQRVLAKINIDF